MAGKLEIAEDAYRRALRIEPSSFSVYVALASVLFLQNKDPEAILALERALPHIERNIRDVR